ncbi:restriction endonuclease subunit S [Micromonospora arida]
MNWRHTSLRAVVEVALGRQRSPQHENGSHIVPYLRAANIKDGALDLSDVLEMNFTPKEQDTFALRPGDVLLTEGSGSRSVVGASAVWRGEIGSTVCFQNTLLRLRARPEVIDGRFLAWWAQAARDSGTFASIAEGANIYHLSAEKVRQLPLRLPPLGMQRRIAEFLNVETSRLGESWHALIQLRALLLERRAAAVHAFVSGAHSSGEMVPSGLPWTSDIPKHWRVARLGLLAQMGSGHTPSRSKPEWWRERTIPWITTGEVSQLRDDRREVLTKTRELISVVGMANSSAELHPAGTVVLCRTASAGYSAIMGAAMATSQDFVTWTCGPRLNPYYLLWCLRAMRSDLLGRLAMGSTHKTIYVPDLQALKVPVPPLDEQSSIVARIQENNSSLDATVDAVSRQINLVSERRKALVVAGVNGQLEMHAA